MTANKQTEQTLLEPQIVEKKLEKLKVLSKYSLKSNRGVMKMQLTHIEHSETLVDCATLCGKLADQAKLKRSDCKHSITPCEKNSFRFCAICYAKQQVE